MKIIEDFLFRNFVFYKRICYRRLSSQDLSDVFDMLGAMYMMTEARSKTEPLSPEHQKMQKHSKVCLDVMDEILSQREGVCRGGLFKRLGPNFKRGAQMKKHNFEREAYQISFDPK